MQHLAYPRHHPRQQRPVGDGANMIGEGRRLHIQPDGRLPGRFDQNWRPTVQWSCLTGDCQLAINWARLHQITGEARYREAVGRILGFVKRTQRLDGKPDERGGVKGSHPINGGYHPWQYPNWAAKFFADALMLEMTLAQSPDAATTWRFTNDG